MRLLTLRFVTSSAAGASITGEIASRCCGARTDAPTRSAHAHAGSSNSSNEARDISWGGGGKGWDSGKGGKGWDMGKGKGKGKKGKDRGPSGPNLPRARISTEPVTGEVAEWKGKYGWIKPTVPIEHPMAQKNQGNIYVSMSDLQGGLQALTPGSLCQFQLFSDSSGLGAEEVIGS